MRLIIDALITITMLAFFSNVAEEFYYFVKKESLTKVAQGLLPMEPFTQKLTGKKFDENFNLVPLKKEKKQ